MASHSDDMRRRTNYAPTMGYPQQAMYSHPASHAQILRTAQYMQPNASMMHSNHGTGDSGIDSLSSAMGAMLPPTSYAPNQRGMHSQAGADYNSVSMSHSSPMYYSSAPPMMYSSAQYGGSQYVPTTAMSSTAGMYAHVNPYNQQTQSLYSPYTQQQQLPAHNATPEAWSNRLPSESSAMPSLVTPRRGSTASAEEHQPNTPYTGNTGQGNYGNGVAVYDRSSSGPYNGASSSPSPFVGAYSTPHTGKAAIPSSTPLSLQLLVAQEPRIPPAIPAPSSPMKPLDRCLENKNGETNVYIRGLLPETTDEQLRGWGSRFGEIVSSKSIIDHKTDLCKGFGFIKYHNFDDAENCIRGFHFLGYEVSFARESFYAKLKKFSDEGNTNLYVSNIPKKMNEHELSEVFLPFNVCSARILRDNEGNGRGVGFARFESRDVCEEVIQQFNNFSVIRDGDEDEYIIQIRYADTQEQKLLKQQTAAARQFRAAEFEFGCQQAGLGSVTHGDRTGSLSPVTSNSSRAHQWDQYTSSNMNPSIRSAYLASRPSVPSVQHERDSSAVMSAAARTGSSSPAHEGANRAASTTTKSRTPSPEPDSDKVKSEPEDVDESKLDKNITAKKDTKAEIKPATNDGIKA